MNKDVFMNYRIRNLLGFLTDGSTKVVRLSLMGSGKEFSFYER